MSTRAQAQPAAMEAVSSKISKHSQHALPLNEGAQNAILRMISTPADACKPEPPLTFSKSGVLHTYGDTPLHEAFKMLVEQRISGMPVVGRGNIRFYGFFDLVDVVNFVARTFRNHTWSTEGEFTQIYNEVFNFNTATVKEVMTYKSWKSAPYHPLPSSYSLFTAFEMMARSGFPRVAVLNANKEIASVITNSMMLKWVKDHIGLLSPALRHTPASSLILHHGEVHTIGTGERALLAFQRMQEENISGLGVVDISGKLCDVISARDLRGLTLDQASMWRLFSTVGNYKSALKLLAPDTPTELHTVTAEDSFEAIVDKLCQHKIHRVFMVNAHGKPLKCICARDIFFNLLVQQPEA